MEESDTPYVFRDEQPDGNAVDADPDPEGGDVVIIDGRAMTYRRYRGAE
ncbi:hypothetical protein [Candidatus Halobonum tyrrellensis]|nr:hypothetical protein [Candidatus Halobonum tyrrellensis]